MHVKHDISNGVIAKQWISEYLTFKKKIGQRSTWNWSGNIYVNMHISAEIGASVSSRLFTVTFRVDRTDVRTYDSITQFNYVETV